VVSTIEWQTEGGMNLPPSSGNIFEAIQASEFTLGESLNPKRQMVVHQLYAKAIGAELTINE